MWHGRGMVASLRLSPAGGSCFLTTQHPTPRTRLIARQLSMFGTENAPQKCSVGAHFLAGQARTTEGE